MERLSVDADLHFLGAPDTAELDPDRDNTNLADYPG